MRGPLAALAICIAAGACAPSIEGVDNASLTNEVGRAVGDQNTCVLLVGANGDVAWRYGTHMTCARVLPACDEAGGKTSVDLVAKAAVEGATLAISCPSRPDGSTTVGWAAGPVRAAEGAAHEPLFFAAVMEGERALPGREITARLEDAFADAGL